MERDKLMPALAWIAGLTIAAFLFAHLSAVIVRRSLDAAVPGNGENAAAGVSSAGAPAAGTAEGRHGGTGSRYQEGTDPGLKVEQISEAEWVVERSSIPTDSRGLNRLLMQARAELYRGRGGTVGVRIAAIRAGSFYDRIGLRKGDVLLSVNAQKLDNPGKFPGLYQAMRKEQHISLLLSRDGQERTFSYDIR